MTAYELANMNIPSLGSNDSSHVCCESACQSPFSEVVQWAHCIAPYMHAWMSAQHMWALQAHTFIGTQVEFIAMFNIGVCGQMAKVTTSDCCHNLGSWLVAFSWLELNIMLICVLQ